MKLRRVASTRGWRLLRYEWTPTGRRRTYFAAPDGSIWQQVPPAKATHIRRFRDLTPTYLRRVDRHVK